MMKKYLITLIALLVTASGAQASVSIMHATDVALHSTAFDGANPASVYSEVEKLYAEGTLPTTEDMTAWISGRCYMASDQSAPLNGLVIGQYEKQDHGPILPGEMFKIFALWYNYGKPADKFDLMTDALARELTSLMSREGNLVTVPATENNALKVSYSTSTTWSFRKNGNYIVNQWLEGGKPHAYCYYFKKVK